MSGYGYVERPGWAIHRRTGAVTPAEAGWWLVVAYDDDEELTLRVDAATEEFARARAAGFGRPVSVPGRLSGRNAYTGGVSRGLGRIERAVLAAVDDGRDNVRAVARAAYGTDEPTEAQQVSVRRAIRSLERKGLLHGETHTYRQEKRVVYDMWSRKEIRRA